MSCVHVRDTNRTLALRTPSHHRLGRAWNRTTRAVHISYYNSHIYFILHTHARLSYTARHSTSLGSARLATALLTNIIRTVALLANTIRTVALLANTIRTVAEAQIAGDRGEKLRL